MYLPQITTLRQASVFLLSSIHPIRLAVLANVIFSETTKLIVTNFYKYIYDGGQSTSWPRDFYQEIIRF